MKTTRWIVPAIWSACGLSLVGDLADMREAKAAAAVLFSVVLLLHRGPWMRRASGRLAVAIAGGAVILVALHGHSAALVVGAAQNVSVVVLLLCVSLLRLPVKVSGLDQELALPLRHVGEKARVFAVTLLSSLLAPILNLGTVAFLGAFLKGRSNPEASVPQAITRGVGAAMLWSPTFAPVALVMAAFPQVSWASTIPIAMPLLAFAVILALLVGGGRVAIPDLGTLREGVNLLRVATLMAAVAGAIGTFRVAIGFPVTASVSLAGLVGFLLWFSCLDRISFDRVLKAAAEHTSVFFDQIAAEAALFLAAGLLAQAFSVPHWAAILDRALGFVHQPTWQAMASIVWGVPLLAVLGVHPIVPFSILVHFVTADSLGVSPPVLYMMWVVVWMLSLIVSPASALNMAASASFGLSSWRLGSGSNWVFGAAFAMVALLVLHNHS